MNKKKKLPIIIGIIVVLIIIVAATSGNGSAKKVDNDGQAAKSNGTTEAKGEQTFNVGETAELKSVQVTLVNVEESEGESFLQPTDGNVFVSCEFEIVNNSSKEINVSSLISFEAYCNDYSTAVSLSALSAFSDKNQLDGTVAPGKKMNGIVAYEVPADWSKLEIEYSPSFWGKAMKFVAEHN